MGDVASCAPDAMRGGNVMDERVRSRRAWLGLLVAVVLYLGLTLPTLDRQGVNWDEHDDRSIALTNLTPGGLWAGSTVELNQTRLPIYLGAIAFRVTGHDSIRVARLLSCGIGVLTILGVWVFCRREWGDGAAIVGSLVLATSPYFLAFSRLAFSEGDIYVTCATVWVAAGWFARSYTVGRAAVLGLAFGVALAAKLSAIALIPAVGLFVLFGRPERPAAGPPPSLREVWPFWLLTAGLIVGGLTGLELGARGIARPGNHVVLVGLAGTAALWVGLLVWSAVRRRAATGRILRITIPAVDKRDKAPPRSVRNYPSFPTSDKYYDMSTWRGLGDAGKQSISIVWRVRTHTSPANLRIVNEVE